MSNLKDTITLAGRSISELQSTQNDIRKDAAKVISDYLVKAKTEFAQIFESEYLDEIESYAEKALGYFDIVDTVSTISGVKYRIPWDREWESEVMSCRIENLQYDEKFGLGLRDSRVLNRLHNLLESMEYDNDMWHNSRC